MNIQEPKQQNANTQFYAPEIHGNHSHSSIRVAAKTISVIFHPLFIPIYLSAFLIYVTPAFPGFAASGKLLLLIRFLVMYTVFPLATVLLAKGLGFIDSIFLKSQRDRIVPYIACGLYYFWMWYVLKNQPEFPKEVVLLSLAIFLASSAGLVVNSYIKVSMHAISAGVMCAFIFSISFLSDVNYGFYLSIAVLLAGVICSVRLVNNDHNPLEVYTGFFIGVLAMFVAYVFT